MAKPRRYVRHSTENPEIEAVQDRVEEAIGGIADHELLAGVHVTGAALQAGETTVVKHSLGRVPKGRQVTSQNAQAQIWDAKPATSSCLYLGTTADVTVSLWVF
jgi:hypothetical protein